jgi:uncharacterized membrane protein
MPAFVTAYLASVVVFLAIDFVWLSTATNFFYRPQMGSLLSSQPNLVVAAAFYLVYVVGIVVFAVLPAANQGSWLMALGLGALLGLVAYGTYDITNLATIRDWPPLVTIVDLAWGTALTAVSALAGYWALRLWS